MTCGRLEVRVFIVNENQIHRFLKIGVKLRNSKTNSLKNYNENQYFIEF